MELLTMNTGSVSSPSICYVTVRDSSCAFAWMHIHQGSGSEGESLTARYRLDFHNEHCCFAPEVKLLGLHDSLHGFIGSAE